MRFPVPSIILVLALALLVAAPVAFVASRRGGRLRGMPGWVGFWCFYAALLVCLSRAEHWLSFPLLAILMFAGLRDFFFLAPVRPQDRWAIVASYLAVPCALYPAWYGSYTLLGAIVSAGLFLLLPVLVSGGFHQGGLLDSTGRVLLGTLLFVFCGAHLGLMAHQAGGRLELFAILVLATELPQRLAGRLRAGERLRRPVAGVLLSFAMAAGLGAWLGPIGGATMKQGAVAGVLIALAVTAGAIVAEAVAQDLGLSPAASSIGRAAILDRAMPALYPAPIVYHFFAQFARHFE